MTDIKYAHKCLEKFCKDNPGIAIGSDIFTFLVKKSIDALNMSGVNYHTNSKFTDLEVRISGDIDYTNMKITLDKTTSPTGGIDNPVIIIENLTINLSIKLYEEVRQSYTLMSKHALDYSIISGGISVSKSAINLYSENSIGSWSSDGKVQPWVSMIDLPNGMDFTNKLKDEWRVQEGAIKLVSNSTLGRALIEGIEIPDIIKMFTSVVFDGAVVVGGEQDLIMFSGPAHWKISCPRREALLSEGTSNRYTKTRKIEGEAPVTSGHLDPEDPNAKYPPTNPIPAVSNADIFTYLPRPFVKQRFEGVLKPAAGISDSGCISLIYWHYDGSIIVQTLDINMTSLWPLEFKMDLPSRVIGVAGAGIKIGCVYYEAANVAFSGDIDPFEIFFTLGQDSNNGELYFESKFGTVHASQFIFTHSPKLEFPIDQIVDTLGTVASENFMSSKSQEVLNVARFTLVNYNLFRGFGKMNAGMAAEKSGDAVTVGVSFVKKLTAKNKHKKTP